MNIEICTVYVEVVYLKINICANNTTNFKWPMLKYWKIIVNVIYSGLLSECSLWK